MINEHVARTGNGHSNSNPGSVVPLMTEALRMRACNGLNHMRPRCNVLFGPTGIESEVLLVDIYYVSVRMT